MFRFLMRTVIATTLSFAVKQYLEAEIRNKREKEAQ